MLKIGTARDIFGLWTNNRCDDKKIEFMTQGAPLTLFLKCPVMIYTLNTVNSALLFWCKWIFMTMQPCVVTPIVVPSCRNTQRCFQVLSRRFTPPRWASRCPSPTTPSGSLCRPSPAGPPRGAPRASGPPTPRPRHRRGGAGHPPDLSVLPWTLSS